MNGDLFKKVNQINKQMEQTQKLMLQHQNRFDEIARKFKASTEIPTTIKIAENMIEQINRTREIAGLNRCNHFRNSVTLNLHDTITRRIKNIYQSFNWDLIREGLRKEINGYESFMSEFDKDLWAMDEEMLIYCEEENNKQFSPEEYVEERLCLYINYFRTNDLYKDHIKILEQAYSAYENKQYALAVFALFATIDSLITSTFEDYEIDLQMKAHLKKHKNKLYYKVADYIESTQDKLAFYLMFFRRVFNVYQCLFKPIWESHPKQINRNWIMHGSYDYNRITKTDVLKLFQLVKAAEVVENISFRIDQEEAL